MEKAKRLRKKEPSNLPRYNIGDVLVGKDAGSDLIMIKVRYAEIKEGFSDWAYFGYSAEKYKIAVILEKDVLASRRSGNHQIIRSGCKQIVNPAESTMHN